MLCKHAAAERDTAIAETFFEDSWSPTSLNSFSVRDVRMRALHIASSGELTAHPE